MVTADGTAAQALRAGVPRPGEVPSISSPAACHHPLHPYCGKPGQPGLNSDQDPCLVTAWAELSSSDPSSRLCLSRDIGWSVVSPDGAEAGWCPEPFLESQAIQELSIPRRGRRRGQPGQSTCRTNTRSVRLLCVLKIRGPAPMIRLCPSNAGRKAGSTVGGGGGDPIHRCRDPKGSRSAQVRQPKTAPR